MNTPLASTAIVARLRPRRRAALRVPSAASESTPPAALAARRSSTSAAYTPAMSSSDPAPKNASASRVKNGIASASTTHTSDATVGKRRDAEAQRIAEDFFSSPNSESLCASASLRLSFPSTSPLKSSRAVCRNCRRLASHIASSAIATLPTAPPISDPGVAAN